MKVDVLLSSYNGEKYIKEQIDSLLNQNIEGLKIVVRDDGSKDKTLEILQSYKKDEKVDYYTGENLRSAKSFWDLLKNAPQADYYAFCDQDDFWFENKLSKAIELLSSEKNQNQPLLYCGSVIVTDDKLNPIAQSVSEVRDHYTDFAHSLIYSLAPGCTFVFNDLAREQMLKFDVEKYGIYMHDWLAHQIIAMTGKVLYDKNPYMYYRQHGNNVVGAQKQGLKKYIEKIKRFFGAKTPVRSTMALAILEQYKDSISQENIEILNLVANYKINRILKKQFKKDSRFKSRGINKLALKVLITMNKV